MWERVTTFRNNNMELSYFAPKSFIKWGPPKNPHFRLSYFEIPPLKEIHFYGEDRSDTDNFYWCGVTLKGNAFTASAWQNRKWQSSEEPFSISSPPFISEEIAIRWLEKELKKIAKKKIIKLNKKLKDTINSNLGFINNLKVQS